MNALKNAILFGVLYIVGENISLISNSFLFSSAGIVTPFSRVDDTLNPGGLQSAFQQFRRNAGFIVIRLTPTLVLTESKETKK